MNTNMKCYRQSCPYYKAGKCASPQGSCGGNRWTRKPKTEMVK